MADNDVYETAAQAWNGFAAGCTEDVLIVRGDVSTRFRAAVDAAVAHERTRIAKRLDVLHDQAAATGDQRLALAIDSIADLIERGDL